jgi:hypothetical protein
MLLQAMETSSSNLEEEIEVIILKDSEEEILKDSEGEEVEELFKKEEVTEAKAIKIAIKDLMVDKVIEMSNNQEEATEEIEIITEEATKKTLVTEEIIFLKIHVNLWFLFQ